MRNQHGLKDLKQTYRIITGIKFEQWADRATREECQEIVLQDTAYYLENIFIIRKISDGYRVYKSIQ